MGVWDSNTVAPGQRASQLDATNHSPDPQAAAEPSYVQSVLFGRKRPRGKPVAPVRSGDASRNEPTHASPPTLGLYCGSPSHRPTPELERN